MKQLWILNHYAQEPGQPGGTRHFSLARYLGGHGWRAHVLAASVELNTDRQRLPAGECCCLEECDGVPFLWLRTPVCRGSERRRIANMLVYTARAIWPSCTRALPPPQAIIGSSVHPFAAWAGAILAKRHGVPFLFEVRDLWPQTLIDMGRLRASSPHARMLRWLEKWLYRRARRIIVLLPNAGDYIRSLGIDSSKIVWIPNGVDLAEFPARPLSVHPEFTLMYFGAHGNANGLDNILHAMALLKGRSLSQSVRLRLIGDGPLKAALADKARALNLDKVRFEDPVPKNAIPAVAAEADAFVFNLIDAPVFRYGISSNKLFDFMAAARPILFCCASSNNPVEEAGAGITVQPGDPRQLAAAVERLMAMPFEVRSRMGEAGRRHVEAHHDFRELAKRLARVLDEE